MTEKNLESVIFNVSKWELFVAEKKLLSKGLNFYLAFEKLAYVEYLVHFELFYVNIRNLEVLPIKT